MSEGRVSQDVLVVDDKGTNLGRMSFEVARTIANSKGLDLVKVGQDGGAAVFRIMDRGKWQYGQRKSQKNNKQRVPQSKEMKFRMRIDTHDMQTKVNHIKKFLSKGHTVKILVEMRGRERSAPLMAHDKLTLILDSLGEVFRRDEKRITNSSVSILIHPKPGI